MEVIEILRQNIKDFKKKVDKVIVLWTANTEETVPEIQSLSELNRLIEQN